MPDTLVNPKAATATGADPAAFAEIVRDCAGKRLPIVDYGVAHQGLGNPPPAEHLGLTQAGGIIEHYERDYTVRVAAGMRLGDLQAALLKTRQFLPVDADGDLTVGEIINHHVYGGLRAGYGSIRDHLLGLRYLDGQGRQIHVGGRTVKNVAGYDVTRLMVGSLGELGVVYEATARTYAVPEQTMTVDLELGDTSELDWALSTWLLSDAAPAWMFLRPRGPEGGGGPLDPGEQRWSLQVGFFGRITGCVAQLHALESITGTVEGMGIAGTTNSTLERDLGELAVQRRWRREAAALVKVIVPPAFTGRACKSLAAWAWGGTAGFDLKIDAMPVHGCIFAGGALNATQACSLDQKINDIIQPVSGLRVWHARPAGAQTIPPFGPAQPDWAMLGRLKQTMDPAGLFNPGRFLVSPTHSG